MFQIVLNNKLNYNYEKVLNFFLSITIIVIPAFTINSSAQGKSNTVIHSKKTFNFKKNLGIQSFEVESVKLISGVSKTPGSRASGGYVVCLTKSVDGVKFSNMPASSKLAIGYASVSVGTISVSVNNRTTRKVYIHPYLSRGLSLFNNQNCYSKDLVL
jgi:hypothetical protein